MMAAASTASKSLPTQHLQHRFHRHHHHHQQQQQQQQQRMLSIFPLSFIFAVIIFLLQKGTLTAKDTWWSLGLQGREVWQNPPMYVPSSKPPCQRVRGLSVGQMRFCQLYQDHMPVVSVGAKNGIDECQWQFRSRRWNCSTVNDTALFGTVTDIGSAETAFTHAILAAGVVHAVSRACREGELGSCGCSRQPRPKELNRDWIWGGCGDNADYGYKFTQGFVDIREREKNYPRHSKELARMLMNLHNNEAGRRAVYKYARVSCKCHGVSGSCSLKTCWNQLPSFRETGLRLKERYDSATEVRFNHQGTSLVQKHRRFNRPTKEDLIYLEPSPDYCTFDPTTGSLGTQGRRCVRSSAAIDGCNLLCCGRGYNAYKQKLTERCNCKFQWCCFVKCKTCERVVEEYTCK